MHSPPGSNLNVLPGTDWLCNCFSCSFSFTLLVILSMRCRYYVIVAWIWALIWYIGLGEPPLPIVLVAHICSLVRGTATADCLRH